MAEFDHLPAYWHYYCGAPCGAEDQYLERKDGFVELCLFAGRKKSLKWIQTGVPHGDKPRNLELKYHLSLLRRLPNQFLHNFHHKPATRMPEVILSWSMPRTTGQNALWYSVFWEVATQFGESRVGLKQGWA